MKKSDFRIIQDQERREALREIGSKRIVRKKNLKNNKENKMKKLISLFVMVAMLSGQFALAGEGMKTYAKENMQVLENLEAAELAIHIQKNEDNSKLRKALVKILRPGVVVAENILDTSKDILIFTGEQVTALLSFIYDLGVSGYELGLDGGKKVVVFVGDTASYIVEKIHWVFGEAIQLGHGVITYAGELALRTYDIAKTAVEHIVDGVVSGLTWSNEMLVTGTGSLRDIFVNVYKFSGQFVAKTAKGTWGIVEYTAGTFYNVFEYVANGILTVSDNALAGAYNSGVAIVKTVHKGGKYMIQTGVKIVTGVYHFFGDVWSFIGRLIPIFGVDKNDEGQAASQESLGTSAYLILN